MVAALRDTLLGDAKLLAEDAPLLDLQTAAGLTETAPLRAAGALPATRAATLVCSAVAFIELVRTMMI